MKKFLSICFIILSVVPCYASSLKNTYKRAIRYCEVTYDNYHVSGDGNGGDIEGCREEYIKKYAPYNLDEYKKYFDYCSNKFSRAEYEYCLSEEIDKVRNDSKNISSSVVYQENVNSMVHVKTQKAQGSGVIVEADGTFLTCFHVIADAEYITVQTNDGTVYNVNGFKYLNPLEDIEILTIDTNKTFIPIEINSDELKIGEKVYTISNPQGLQFVFSDGMLSQYTKEYIQFSAPISSGSSGGALLNEEGALIGIITSFFKNGQNLNLALPNNYYVQKFGNPTIINKSNKKWTDFVIENVSNDQFKLYTDYAINEKNITLLYKYLMPLTKYPDFPKSLYAAVATFALIEYAGTYDDNAADDAVYLYEQSIYREKNIEPSLVGLFFLYAMRNESVKIEKCVNLLSLYYPKSVTKILNLLEEAKSTKIDYATFMAEYCAYILSIIKYED